MDFLPYQRIAVGQASFFRSFHLKPFAARRINSAETSGGVLRLLLGFARLSEGGEPS